MKKLLSVFLVVMLLLTILPVSAEETGTALAWQNYNGKRIGVLTGTLMEDIAYTNFPDSEYLLLNSYPDCIAALLANKIDAYLGDEPSLKTIHAEQPKIDYIHERITNQEYSFAFRKNDEKSAALCAELNTFLALCHQDGTMQELDDIWFGVDEERKVVDMSDLTGENGTIRVVTTSTDMPFSYIKDGKNVGYDIDLVVRFCRHAGYRLELGDVDFAARIPAIQSGKYDFTTDMNVTEERKEQVLFSDPTSTGGVVLAILTDGSTASAQQSAAVSPFTQFSGKRIGVEVGTTSGQQVEARIPDAILSYYNNQTDLLAALRANKIDAWGTDETVPKFLMMENDDLTIVDGYLDTFEYAPIFAKTEKGQTLRDQYSAFVDSLWENGVIQGLDEIWYGKDETKRTVLDYEALPDTNGTLRMAVDTSIIPFAYVKDNRIVGYDVDIAARFCQEYGYRLAVEPMDFGGILAAVQSGKADFAACGITVTEERKESVLFGSADYKTGAVLAVLKSEYEPAAYALSQTKTVALEDLATARIGVLTGTISGQLVEKRLPRAQVNYYTTQTDSLAALKAGKIDAWSTDEPIIRFMKIENPELVILDEYLAESNLAAVFSKTEAGQELCSQYNEFLEKLWADGTMKEIDGIWFGADEANRTVMDYENLPAANGTLRMAADLTQPPFTYMKENRAVGYDIDVAARFCQAYCYGLEIVPMEFGGILPSVQSGKCDFATSCITITEERAESVLFSAPNYYGGIAVAVWQDSGASAQETAGTAGIASLDDLATARIGVQTGTTFDEIVLETLPDAKISYFNSYPDMAAALEANKIDAFPGDEPVIRLMAAENSSLAVLEERMDSFDFGIAIPKTDAGAKLLAEINAWLAAVKESGDLEQITVKWTEGPESEKSVPDYAAFPAPNGVLTLATEGAYAPMNYYRENDVVGLEIELIARFCEANGYGLKVTPMLFDAILPAVQSGKADLAAAGMTITEERKESVYFSEPYYTGGTVMAVRKSERTASDTGLPLGKYTAIHQLENAKIGVQTGQSFDQLVKQALPDAEIVYVNSKADLINQLSTEKIDAYAVDEPVLKAQMRQDDRLTAVPEYLDWFEFGFVFPKSEAGQALCAQFDEFLRGIKADGTLEEIELKWNTDSDIKEMPDYQALPAINDTLTLATEALYEPFTYIQNGQIVGYDIEIAVRFCQAYGYALKIEDMNFSGILPAVQSGKCDFGAAGITITEERKESVLFSEPNFSGGTVLAVLKAEQQAAASSVQEESFWDGLASSFNKTFIREGRWKLFLEGIGNTMLITLLSILFGTALGFLVFMLCRNGNIVANGATRFSMWLVTGTPMVVLLMILYYVIFGSVAISGITVAVIGFTLTFGAAVYGLLKMGVGTIDRGQYEAAYALGHSNRHTFFKIILPQAIPHVLPAYQGEIVGLIKATAIVGYIAVQDLTKMGDIVRSRTYEAFFPLIAVTVIYFVLEGLFSFFVSRLRVSIDSKKRKRESILKGIDLHD